MSNSVLLLITIFLISFLGIVLAVVAFSYRQLIKKYYAQKQELDHDAQATQAKVDKILAEAQTKAKEIIATGTSFNQKLEADLAAALQKATENQAQNQKAILDVAQQEMVKVIGSISEDIKSQVTSEFKAFTTQATAQVEKELESYKAEKLYRLNESIYEIITHVSTQAIGKSLSLEDQEELVIQALEKAKSQTLPK